MASPVFKESRDNMDMALFSFLVRGLGRNVKAVDAALGAALSKGGTDAMTMAVLRLGAFEILFGDTPRAVASKEYTDIAACFVSARRTALVNAVLSALKG
jgi:N utilization substance protein B